jgi:AraC-like DNA-binding protein
MDNMNFDVDRFCLDMRVSRTLLHTKLKKITGLSTTEFIRSIRLKQAYVYLKKGGLTVAEIAYKCGFNDPNYFSRCFKKQYHIFPSKVNNPG